MIAIGNYIKKGNTGISNSYWTTRFPSDLIATTISGTQVDLSWTNNGTADYTGHKIYYSTDNITFTLKATIAIIGTTYSVTGLTAGTLYYFYIKAYKGGSVSAATNTDSSLTTQTVVDADGNTYTLVSIGGQVFIVENLKTTKYNDDSSIPTGLSDANWALEDGTPGHDGAFAQVNNDAGNKASYGLLYNWYAVNNSKGIAPSGFHVFSNDEFTRLATWVGGTYPVGGIQALAGEHLREAPTARWDSGAFNGDNTSGFTAVGTGYRDSAGAYQIFRIYNLIWSATAHNATDGKEVVMGNDSKQVQQSNVSKKTGCAVRCIENTKFSDNLLEDIASSLTAYGEPTALVSDDGNQIDLWFMALVTGVVNIYYSYSTDGLTFSVPTITNVPAGYKRHHILKSGSTYYLYAVTGDTSMHLFTGTNKTTFTDQGEVLTVGAAGAWDSEYIANMFVWKEDSNWYMLYDGHKNGVTPWKQGLATASAASGPWTKYASNPVFAGVLDCDANIEIPRVNNEIIKHNGKYYAYYMAGNTDINGHVSRAYSTDLHTWTLEGPISTNRKIHTSTWSYGDECLVQFQGKSYLFWSASNQVDTSHIDVGVDNRPLVGLLALNP